MLYCGICNAPSLGIVNEIEVDDSDIWFKTKYKCERCDGTGIYTKFDDGYGEFRGVVESSFGGDA